MKPIHVAVLREAICTRTGTLTAESAHGDMWECILKLRAVQHVAELLEPRFRGMQCHKVSQTLMNALTNGHACDAVPIRIFVCCLTRLPQTHN